MKYILKEIFSTIVMFLVMFLVILGVYKYIAEPFIVDGASMEYTLRSGERLWMLKLNNIDRFDVYRIYESLQWMQFSEMPLVEKQNQVSSIIDKLTRYKEMKLGTETAKKLWIERLDYQLSFYEKLKAQLDNSSATH